MYYEVSKRLSDVPRDHHGYGYEDETSFLAALHKLHARWKGKSGECMEERLGFRRIRFRNIYNHYEDAWLPDFMLTRIPDPPQPVRDREAEAVEEMLDGIFGFD